MCTEFDISARTLRTFHITQVYNTTSVRKSPKTRIMQVCVNLSALPKITLSKKKVHIDPTGCQACAICLEEVGSTPRVETPEGRFLGGPTYWIGCHVFCTYCIADWVSNGSCPECREPVRDDIIHDLRSKVPRRSRRVSCPLTMFTTDGKTASTVTSTEMMERVENLD